MQQVPVPPVMNSPIVLSVPENYVGVIMPSIANFTVDFQDAALTYAIAYGNNAGFFSLDASTGVLSVVATGPGSGGGLNFELASDFVLSVSATEVMNSAMSSTAEVEIAVINVNDAPTIPSQLLFVDESVSSSASDLVPISLGTVSFSDEDSLDLGDNDTSSLGWSDDTMSIVNGPLNAYSQPIFDVNASTGELALVQPLLYTLAESAYFFQGW